MDVEVATNTLALFLSTEFASNVPLSTIKAVFEFAQIDEKLIIGTTRQKWNSKLLHGLKSGQLIGSLQSCYMIQYTVAKLPGLAKEHCIAWFGSLLSVLGKKTENKDILQNAFAASMDLVQMAASDTDLRRDLSNMHLARYFAALGEHGRVAGTQLAVLHCFERAIRVFGANCKNRVDLVQGICFDGFCHMSSRLQAAVCLALVPNISTSAEFKETFKKFFVSAIGTANACLNFILQPVLEDTKWKTNDLPTIAGFDTAKDDYLKSVNQRMFQLEGLLLTLVHLTSIDKAGSIPATLLMKLCCRLLSLNATQLRIVPGKEKVLFYTAISQIPTLHMLGMDLLINVVKSLKQNLVMYVTLMVTCLLYAQESSRLRNMRIQTNRLIATCVNEYGYGFASHSLFSKSEPLVETVYQEFSDILTQILSPSVGFTALGGLCEHGLATCRALNAILKTYARKPLRCRPKLDQNLLFAFASSLSLTPCPPLVKLQMEMLHLLTTCVLFSPKETLVSATISLFRRCGQSDSWQLASAAKNSLQTIMSVMQHKTLSATSQATGTFVETQESSIESFAVEESLIGSNASSSKRALDLNMIPEPDAMMNMFKRFKPDESIQSPVSEPQSLPAPKQSTPAPVEVVEVVEVAEVQMSDNNDSPKNISQPAIVPPPPQIVAQPQPTQESSTPFVQPTTTIPVEPPKQIHSSTSVKPTAPLAVNDNDNDEEDEIPMIVADDSDEE